MPRKRVRMGVGRGWRGRRRSWWRRRGGGGWGCGGEWSGVEFRVWFGLGTSMGEEWKADKITDGGDRPDLTPQVITIATHLPRYDAIYSQLREEYLEVSQVPS